MSNSIRVAVLGATSQIAKGLIYNFLKNGGYSLFLFARSPEKVTHFLGQIGDLTIENIFTFENFFQYKYDVVINCVGIADPGKQKNAGLDIFYVTEQYDNMVLEYLRRNNGVMYINFSSGAVYGTSFFEPVNLNSCSLLDINHIQNPDYYRISKLHSEAKHRACGEAVIDLRVFSYFSRFIDLNAKYLMTEIINCVKNRNPFVTGTSDIVRDFVHPEDLFNLVEKVISQKTLNAAFDVYSMAPVKKSEILGFFKEKYNLKVDLIDGDVVTSATGLKNVYYSVNHAASSIGYHPEYSSLKAIELETGELLSQF